MRSPPNRMTLTLTFAALFAVALLEFFRPQRRLEFPAWRRRLGNLGVWLFNIIVGGLIFVAPDTLRPSWSADPLLFVIGVLGLDLLSYWIHRCQHMIPPLWRLHRLHHVERDVDSTTAVKHHPGEFLIATAFFWFVILILRVPAEIALAHGTAVFVLAVATHANVRWPGWLDRLLAPVIITLDAHRVHHSQDYAEANSNFGSVFVWWDLAHGTYRRLSPAEHDNLEFGVKGLVPQWRRELFDYSTEIPE